MKSQDYVEICRLSDDAIKEVFVRVYRESTGGGLRPHNTFLCHLAETVVLANDQDFELIRPSALMTMAHYKLL